MSSNSWNQTLTRANTNGSALTNTTTATSLLPSAEKFVLPANLIFPGTRFKFHAAGLMSTAASAPGTFTIDIRFGSVIVFTGGASPTLATSASNVTWVADIDLVARTYGSGTAATLMGTGTLVTAALSTATPILLLPATTPVAGTGFDSTNSQAVDFFGTWSVASASNTITLNDFYLDLKN